LDEKHILDEILDVIYVFGQIKKSHFGQLGSLIIYCQKTPGNLSDTEDRKKNGLGQVAEIKLVSMYQQLLAAKQNGEEIATNSISDVLLVCLFVA